MHICMLNLYLIWTDPRYIYIYIILLIIDSYLVSHKNYRHELESHEKSRILYYYN